MIKVLTFALIFIALLSESKVLTMPKEKKEKKKAAERYIGAASLISGIALGALYSGRKVYNKYLERYTRETLTGVAMDLQVNIDRTSKDMLTVLDILELKKKNWARLTDQIRGLVGKESSVTLLLYLDNMFPAINRAQADSLLNPTDVSVDLNSENLAKDMLDDVVVNILDNLSGNLAGDVGKDITTALGTMGYANSSTTITMQVIPMLNLITNIYKASLTLNALVVDTQHCLAQLDYAAAEAEILTLDARFSLCDMLRQLRVHTKVHMNMHSYVLHAGAKLPSQEAEDLWNQLTFEITALDNELETLWDRGWCSMFPDNRGASASSHDCLSRDNMNLDSWYCGVDHIFMDDDFATKSTEYKVDVRQSETVWTNNWGVAGTHDIHVSTAPLPAPGSLHFDLDEKQLPPLTHLVMVTADTRYTTPLKFYGLFQQRSFLPTIDMVYARTKFYQRGNALDHLTREAMEGDLQNYIAANFYRETDNMADNAGYQVYMMQTRGGGAPISEIGFCSADQADKNGWYSVHMASIDPRELCPSGTSLYDGSWTPPYKYLCYRKDWSLDRAIDDQELADSEKKLWHYLMQAL